MLYIINGKIQRGKDESIDDKEFALLYDLNASENLEFPSWTYVRLDLDSMTDDECKA